jgi:hypothetical protein
MIGNKKYYTTGLLAKYCDLIIKECRIHNFSLGGIHYLSDNNNKFNMHQSRVLFNSKVGVSLVGNGSSPILEDNIIDNN